jgi:hypothetical protein
MACNLAFRKNVNEPGGYFASTYGNTNWPACGEIDMMEYGIFLLLLKILFRVRCIHRLRQEILSTMAECWLHQILPPIIIFIR